MFQQKIHKELSDKTEEIKALTNRLEDLRDSHRDLSEKTLSNLTFGGEAITLWSDGKKPKKPKYVPNYHYTDDRSIQAQLTDIREFLGMEYKTTNRETKLTRVPGKK